jgi:hypothetical protein
MREAVGEPVMTTSRRGPSTWHTDPASGPAQPGRAQRPAATRVRDHRGRSAHGRCPLPKRVQRQLTGNPPAASHGRL